MFTTKVIWDLDKPTLADYDAIQLHLETLVAQGLTTGMTMSNPLGETKQIIRNWTTEEAAKNWVAYILPYNPISAEALDS